MDREIEPAKLGSYHRSSLAYLAVWLWFAGCTGLAAAPAAFLSRFKVFALKTSKTCQFSLRPGLICLFMRTPLNLHGLGTVLGFISAPHCCGSYLSPISLYMRSVMYEFVLM